LIDSITLTLTNTLLNVYLQLSEAERANSSDNPRWWKFSTSYFLLYSWQVENELWW